MISDDSTSAYGAFTDEEWDALERYHNPGDIIGSEPHIEIHRGLVVVASVDDEGAARLSVYTVAQVKRALRRARAFVAREVEEGGGFEFELYEGLFETDGIKEHCE